MSATSATSARLIDICLPGDLAAAGLARETLGTCVADRELADDGKLLLSEAVANAVEHGGSDRLRLVIRHDTATGSLMCAVRDDSAEMARTEGTPAGCAERESGRGLAIIAALSLAWGFSTDGFGKWLWFCLGAAG
ncbi:ATP-binding protein [Streptomyces sp. NPDC048507]|uniref:ATP-binding protein n=1 Tax=Streptomyces sp. NPDC048507 TaxID=3365560 RepID=UPI0037131D87